MVDRARGDLAHRQFRDLPEFLRPSDVLVVNDSRVLPARLRGYRTDTGGRWEGLFLHERSVGVWELLGKTRGRPAPGVEIEIAGGGLTFTLREQLANGHWLVDVFPPVSAVELLERHGEVPLPHYIHRRQPTTADRERYQTVYATRPGSIAAPTAGLHFSRSLMLELVQRGIDIVRVTLHVGLGTFEPIRTERLEDHVMHAEWGELSSAAAAALQRCRAAKGRIVAVGTTSVRVLETAAATVAAAAGWSGETAIFIRPPHQFRQVDALITNFHLPRTTLLALVHAFVGSDLARAAYTEAIRERYRFFSYGDAMLVL